MILRLRGLVDVVNGDLSFCLLDGVLQGVVEDGELPVGLRRRKVFFASKRPAAVQRCAISALRHRLTLRCTVLTVPGAFSMAFVQASARRRSAGRPRRMTARIFVAALQDGLGDPGSVQFQAAGEIAQEPLGLGRVALIPGLAQGLADARVQALVQPICDVASLVHLATLNQGRVPEAPPERLGAVDDVEPGALGIETSSSNFGPFSDFSSDGCFDSGSRLCFRGWPLRVVVVRF